MFSQLSLKQKLLSSFTLVLLFLGLVMWILFHSQFKLGAIQDEGATRLKESGRISELATEVASVYAVSADAIINGNFEETKNDIIEIKVKKDLGIKDLLAIVNTDQEKKPLRD